MMNVLDKNLQVPTLRKRYGRNIYLGVGFDPHLFTFRKHKTWMVKEWIFERMAKEGLGNMVRTCLYGNWRGAFPYIHHPFERDDNGIFQLPDPKKLELNLPEEDRMAEVGKYINSKWYRRIMQNTFNAINRGITVMLDFNVQWQDWDKNWLNPKNCNRDVWPTSSGEWHYYEYWDMEGGERIRRTGLIIENFERYMRNKLEELAGTIIFPGRKPGQEYDAKRFLVFSAGNEVCAGAGWHTRKSNIFDNAYVRKLTSIQFGNFVYLKPSIGQMFQHGVHGIGTLESYRKKQKEFLDNGFRRPWLPCCDGYFPDMPKRRKLKKLVYQSEKDGNLGYGLLHGKWESHSLEKWDFDSVKWMMKGHKKYARENG